MEVLNRGVWVVPPAARARRMATGIDQCAELFPLAGQDARAQILSAGARMTRASMGCLGSMDGRLTETFLGGDG